LEKKRPETSSGNIRSKPREMGKTGQAPVFESKKGGVFKKGKGESTSGSKKKRVTLGPFFA